MTKQPTIAVTGSTGGVGGMVARQLAAAGVPQRLLARDPAKAPQLDGADVHQASYEDVATMTAALHGIDTVLFVSGHEAADRVALHRRAVDAFAAAGVRRVVYTSFLGASPTASFTYARDHHATEELIRDAGLSFTFLRPSFYLDYVAHWADDRGVIRGPAGDGQIAWVAREDLADVAAAVLIGSGHDDTTYDVTGNQLMTLEQTTAQLRELTGRAYRFEDQSVEEAYASRRTAYPSAADWELDGWVGTYLAIARDEMAVASDTVEEITGRSPRTLSEVISAR